MSKIVICMKCDKGLMFMDGVRVMDLSGKNPLGFICKNCSNRISHEEGIYDVVLDVIEDVGLFRSEMLPDQESVSESHRV